MKKLIFLIVILALAAANAFAARIYPAEGRVGMNRDRPWSTLRSCC